MLKKYIWLYSPTTETVPKVGDYVEMEETRAALLIELGMLQLVEEDGGKALSAEGPIEEEAEIPADYTEQEETDGFADGSKR